MRLFLRIFLSTLLVLIGLRLAGILLLFADMSSDTDVLMAFSGLAALAVFEVGSFWVLFHFTKKTKKQNEKEKK
jgi:hypothetical protein